MKQLFLIILSSLILMSCTSKKDNNPLVQKNIAPSLNVTGFNADILVNDTLVFVPDKEYPFSFSAGDELVEPEIRLRVIGGTGRVTLIDTSSSGIYHGTYEPFSRGEHRIEISVSDGLAQTVEILTVFFAANQPPVAVIAVTEISRDLEKLEFTYEFSPALSSDRDSEIVSATWDLDGTVVQKLFTETFRHTFDYYDSYRIALTVTDEYDSTNTTVQTINNSRPIASFTITPSAQARNGTSVTLNASNSQSPNGNISNYRWLFRTPAGMIDILNQATTNTFRYTLALPVGQNGIGLLVSDVAGNTSDTTWSNVTVLNTPPQADFDSDTELEQIIITGNQSGDIDPGDVLTLEWFINDSLLEDYTNRPTPTINIRGDVYQLRLDVTDSQGETTSMLETVSVPGVPESHFVITNVNTNNETRNRETVSLNATASIAGNESRGIDSYTWYMRPQDGLWAVLADTGAALKNLNLAHAVGVYEIGLEITNDEDLVSQRAVKELTVLNSNPTAAFSVQGGGSRSAIVSSNNSADIDPGQTLNYFWFIDGVEDESKRTIKMPTFNGLALGLRTIRLRVRDNAGGFAELERNVLIQ